MGLEDLGQIMAEISTYKDENLIVGYDKNDDAGVFKLTEEIALVESVDFITPIVDDPYVYGQIAASNALSDIYAMGGVPKTALNLLMWDQEHLDKHAVKEILQGGANRLEEAKVTLLGGHTISDVEQKYGLSVTGILNPCKVWKNQQIQEADVLVLTKPLGSGILATALKIGALKFSQDLEGVASMIMLNQKAAQVAQNFDIHSCTDITGFGLVGHLLEMCGDGVSAKLDMENIPLMEGIKELIHQGYIPNGSKQNQTLLSPKVKFQTQSPYEIAIFDSQTSGGLLFALPKSQAYKLVDELKLAGFERSSVIGEVIAQQDTNIILS